MKVEGRVYVVSQRWKEAKGIWNKLRRLASCIRSMTACTPGTVAHEAAKFLAHVLVKVAVNKKLINKLGKYRL